jgi:hypothetical protein
MARVLYAAAGQDLEAGEQSLRLRSPMRFDNANDDIHTLVALGLGNRQHLERFADARRSAEKHLQVPSGLLLHLLEKRIR